MVEEVDSTPATETAAIVPMPAAERVVGERSRHLDPAASWGVPALYPFVHPAALDDAVVSQRGTPLGDGRRLRLRVRPVRVVRAGRALAGAGTG